MLYLSIGPNGADGVGDVGDVGADSDVGKSGGEVDGTWRRQASNSDFHEAPCFVAPANGCSG